ncbi:MAG: zinc ABC transporter substrate-binding protein [Ktedonobacteraceae bacterium]|nr:zinc ABC transporter substrate-binding protein [Ktedonobacteraceae bacterium]
MVLRILQKERPGWLIGVALFVLLLSACGGSPGASGSPPGSSTSKTLNVVAAENFYGDIVKQLGGDHVSVTSILSNPNIDPHEYQSSTQNALAVSKADLVIENGGGYDSWMDKLLSAAPNSTRVVLKGFDIAPTKLPDNEHIWYSIEDMSTIAQSITTELKKLDPANAAAFDANLRTFKIALQPVQQKISEIKAKYAGTPVGLTETIFLYQTEPLGLKVLTPPDFMKAVAEENDPPANTVITAENQINQKQIKVLIYNEQNASPITQRLQKDAQAKGIPVVPVTETMPAGKTYQSWMLDQLSALQRALGG